MSSSSGKRRSLIALAVLLLLLIAIIAPPLIQINRFRHRITDSIAAAIGRPVSADSVQFQLLPRPSLVLSNFVVAEEPAFGAEPLLRAPAVTARIRLRSLLRGRLRISRISLDEPSLNLTRGRDGRWTLQHLLIVAAQATKNAMSAAHTDEFPYIESTNARVNLKVGAEKTPFSLEDVDFAFFALSSGRWRVRLRGRPVRTDIEVEDSGALRLDGTFISAASLNDVQANLTARWDKLQLGELTRLAKKTDAGWRGDVELQAAVAGPLRDLDVTAHAKLFGLRRTEFVPATSIDPELNCTAKFAYPDAALHYVSCILPVAEKASRIEAHGTVSLTSPVTQSDFIVDIDAVPAASLLEAARHARQNLIRDVHAEGVADGSFRWDGSAWHGSAAMPQLTVRSSNGVASPPLVIDALRVAVGDAATPAIAPPVKRRGRIQRQPAAPIADAANTWRLDPLRIDLGGKLPLTLSATATTHGYTVHWNGTAAWDRLMPLTELSPGLRAAARFDRLSASQDGAAGDSTMDLTLHAPWFVTSAQAALVLGTMRVNNVRVASPLLPEQITVPVATAQFTATQTLWTGTAIYAGSQFDGDVMFPARCSADSACVGHFALHAQRLDLAAVTLPDRERGAGAATLAFLERLRPASAAPAPWPSFSGTIRVNALNAGPLVIHDADAQVDIVGRTAAITEMTGQALAGTLSLQGKLNAAERTPQCKLHFTLRHADAAMAGALFHENWTLGAGNVEAHLSSRAGSPQSLAANAIGDFRIDLQQGSLSDIPSLRFDRWSATGSVAGGKLLLKQSTMNQRALTRPVTGTVGFNRTLHLRVGDGSDVTNVSGTIAAPIVSQP